MTHKEFTKYCIDNKVKEIIPDELDGFKIFFENGEFIEISSGYDGIYYQHQSEIYTGDSKQFLKDLEEITPNYIKKLQEEYQEPITIIKQ